jgi:4-hydroxy-tetrahydrodipicolinate synthase
MHILGMPSGGCRQPLGKMSRNGIEKVLTAARSVQSNNPEILKPIEAFFGVNIGERLEDPANWQDLVYPDYQG